MCFISACIQFRGVYLTKLLAPTRPKKEILVRPSIRTLSLWIRIGSVLPNRTIESSRKVCVERKSEIVPLVFFLMFKLRVIVVLSRDFFKYAYTPPVY